MRKAAPETKSARVKDTDKLPPFSEDALYHAQDIAFQAWEESDDQKRAALVKKALAVSPYCTDAYNILAESTEDARECVALYAKGAALAEKAFGKRFFKENEGCFWGILETRPYMRAMDGLAECLWETGKRQEAVGTYQEMLRLNPNDNQGVRDVLMAWLIAEGQFDAAEKVLARYPKDRTLMQYNAVLLHFKQGKKVKARNALKKAVAANPHVPEFLWDAEKKYVPETEAEKRFGCYRPGCPSEASEYRTLAGWVWKESPDALGWLKEMVENL